LVSGIVEANQLFHTEYLTLKQSKKLLERNGLKGLRLWPHQVSAIDMCRRYFKSRSDKAALVQLPTGTGKSGVMAVISSKRSKARPVLVVCPSAALVKQLTNDFSQGFWRKIGATKKWAPEVYQLLPSTVSDLEVLLGSGQGKHVVVIGTVQALVRIHSSKDYRRITDKFGTILFDEGHREPAPQWAAAVRGFNCKTVLFSATPFRNDMKLFNVDSKFTSFMSFAHAVDNHIIRGVRVEEKRFGGALEFARLAIRTRDGLIRSRRFNRSDKMIVRADSKSHVEELFAAFVRELGARDDGVLALHDDFKSSGRKGRLKSSVVPEDLRERSERFVIHQHKLTEGIDDPSFTMLALYDRFSTDRQLVQQIGRLTRMPVGRKRIAGDAYVLAREGDGVAAMWQRFIRFDEVCGENGGAVIRTNRSVLDGWLRQLPEVDYVEGKFRSRIEWGEGALGDIRVPRSAVVYNVDRGFILDRFSKTVSTALVDADRDEVAAGRIDPQCGCHLSIRLKQTPFLSTSLFLSPSLEVTIYALHRSRLFLFDSAGLWMDETDKVKRREGVRSLQSLMPSGGDTVFSAVSMINSDLAPHAVRSRRVTSRSLERADAFIGEKMFLLSQVTGSVPSSVPDRRETRSVGFAKSRVRQGSGYDATPMQFSRWARDVEQEIRQAPPASPFFGRFAMPTEVPADTTPVNILVDIGLIDGEVTDANGVEVKFDLEGLCVDVVEDAAGGDGYRHRFLLELLERDPVTVWIKWDVSTRKYWLKSDELSSFKIGDNARNSLTQRINKRQSFRVVPAASRSVYAYGEFYDAKLDLSVGGAANLVKDLVAGLKELRTTSSEKGDRANATNWTASSVFGVVDKNARHKSKFGQPFTGLVCDDLGTEVADFVATDDGIKSGEARAVFIAAKWADGEPGVGASPLYDICAQVTKNLPYLKADAPPLPSSPAKWKGKLGKIARLRLGSSPSQVRKEFSAIRRNPNARRQTWMVLGGGLLSRAKLEKEFQRPAPKPHVLQFYYLMLSTYSACQSVGIDLKVFCAD
jgi:superfamily II DNA or RNA helicase